MSELVKSVSIEALLMHRDSILIEMAKILECNKKIRQILPMFKHNDGMHEREISHNSLYRTSNSRYMDIPLLKDEDLENAKKALDSELWQLLMHQSGMLTFMDAKARDAWSKQCREHQTPELTRDNIESTFKSLSDSKLDFFERGVLNIADRLNKNYKTNQVHKFSQRIIITLYYHNSEAGAVLDDLNRALHLLDGKPEPDMRNGIGANLCSYGTRVSFIDTPYLQVKRYKNNNAHILIKSQESIDGLNRIIAKHYPHAIAAPKESKK